MADPLPQQDLGPGVELTVDELAAAAGIPVRRIRFYAGKRLLPPPRLEGRTGWYGPAHLARLQLVGRLQEQGYTLAAIEDLLAGLPEDADAATVELHGQLLAPTAATPERLVAPEELREHCGRRLAAHELDALEDAHLLRRDADGLRMSEAQLEFVGRLLRLGAPLDVLVEAGGVVQRHVGSMAAELQELFRTRIVEPATGDAGLAEDDRLRLRELGEALRPVTIQAMVGQYQQALAREVRRGRADGADVG